MFFDYTNACESLSYHWKPQQVGVNVGGDANKVYKDHNVSVEALQDLSSLANQKLGGKPKRWSLGSLTETLICKKVGFYWISDILSLEFLISCAI